MKLMGIWNWFGGAMDDGEEVVAEDDAGLDATDDALEDDPGGSETPDDGPDLVEIEHQLGELEDGLERNEGRIENVQHSQQEVAERVEEINGVVRDLLGVYDQLTADANPFTDGTDAGSGASGFGVVNGNGEHANGAGTGGDEEPEEDRFADEPVPAEAENGAEVEDPDDDLVTFEDVVAGMDESAESTEPTEPAEPVETTAPAEDDGSEADRPVPEAEAAEPVPAGGEPTATGRDAGASDAGGRDEDPAMRTPYLADLPAGYAVDVLVFEWLGELVETAGPAAALKAVSYYEDIDWIGSSVAATLDEYLSGPGIDIYVDPNEPDDLTAEDHATSYEYILKLDAIGDLERTT